MTATTKRRIAQPIHPDLISREEAAVMLGVSSSYVANGARALGITEYKIAPKFIRVDRVEIEALVAKRARSARN